MLGAKKTQAVAAASAAPPPASGPLRGSLYAQLLCADDKKMALRCSQKLWLGKDTACKLFGMFKDGEPPRTRAQVKHKLFVTALNTRVSGRVRYEANQNLVKGTVYIKHRLELGSHTAVNAKLELHARTSLEAPKTGHDISREVQARVELSHKMLNITDSQDCRLRVGVDVGRRTGFLELRENHCSLKVDTANHWSVLYDL